MTKTLSAGQRAALRALVDQGELTAAQCDRVETVLAGEASSRLRRRLPEIVCYLGGALLLGGSLLLIEPLDPYWRELPRLIRSALLAAIALLLACVGVATADGRAGLRPPTLTARHRLAAVLLVFAALVAALSGGELTRELTWAALAGMAVAAAGYALVPSALGLLTTVALSAVAVGSATDDFHRGIWPGLALIVTSLLWGALTAAGVLAQRQTGYLAAVGVTVAGLLHLNGPFVWTYSLTFAVAVVCLAGYARDRSPVLLSAGIGGVAIAACEMTADLTDGIATPAIVLIAGALLLLSSAAALHHRRRSGHSLPVAGQEVPETLNSDSQITGPGQRHNP